MPYFAHEDFEDSGSAVMGIAYSGRSDSQRGHEPEVMMLQGVMLSVDGRERGVKAYCQMAWMIFLALLCTIMTRAQVSLRFAPLQTV